MHDIYASRRELEGAAAEERWSEVGTANARFYEEIVAFLGSPRRRKFVRALMTKLRLGLCAMPDARAMHEPCVSWNRRILAVLVEGQTAEARQELERGLWEAERQVAEAVRDVGQAGNGGS